MKLRSLFMGFVLLLFLVNRGYCNITEDTMIPKNTDKFSFSIIHKNLITGSKEEIVYKYTKKGMPNYISYKLSTKTETVNLHVDVEPYNDGPETIITLNYNRYMLLPSKILIDTSTETTENKVKTVTVFTADFIDKDKRVNKRVLIENMEDSAFIKENPDAYKLLYIFYYYRQIVNVYYNTN